MHLNLAPERNRMLPFESAIFVPNQSFRSCNNTDPLTHYGRHFCRTVHALCNFQTLLTNGLLKIGELADVPDEDFTAEYARSLWTFLVLLIYFRQRREHAIFQELLKAVPGLEERLVTGSDDEVTLIAELVSIILLRCYFRPVYSLCLIDSQRSIWCSRRRH